MSPYGRPGNAPFSGHNLRYTGWPDNRNAQQRMPTKSDSGRAAAASGRSLGGYACLTVFLGLFVWPVVLLGAVVLSVQRALPDYGAFRDSIRWSFYDERTWQSSIALWGPETVEAALKGDGVTLTLYCDDPDIFEPCVRDNEAMLCIHRQGQPYSVVRWGTTGYPDTQRTRVMSQLGDAQAVQSMASDLLARCRLSECRDREAEIAAGRFCHEIP